MSRPKPTILLCHIDPKTFKAVEVLAGEDGGIYTVYFNGRPISVRSRSTLLDYPGPKYQRMGFPTSGQAHLLCRKLRKLFKDDRFEVMLLTDGQVIKPA